MLRLAILVAIVAMCFVLANGTTSTLYAQGVPQQAGPLGVAPTAKQIELGRKLFFDRRLSADNTVACATCHNPDLGWGDGRRVAIGIRGQAGTRNSPTIINSSYSPLMFWDGRTVGQMTQALLPLVNPVEMGNQSEQQVITKLQLIRGYTGLFDEAYGPDVSTGNPNPITAARYAHAMASFQETIVSFDAPIDRFLAGDPDALSADAKVGYNIFAEANCIQCHKPPLYTDLLVHNNGMEFAGKATITDNGRFSVLLQNGIARNRIPAGDVRAFKTPTLRNLKHTAPYNHAGNFDTIKRCVIHYSAGGANSQGRVDAFQDPRIKKLNLTPDQVDYLTLFLDEGFAGIDYPMSFEPELP